MRGLLQPLRHTIRLPLKSPGFTIREALVTYFVSTVGGDGSEGWSLRSLFSSFLAFFSRSLFRFSN